MYFKQILIGGFDQNFSYFIGDEKSKEIFVVDPDNLELLKDEIQAEDLKVKGVLITHTHHDHIVGVTQILEDFGGEVFVHKLGVERIKSKVGKELSDKVIEIEDDDKIEIGSLEIRVIYCPGHSPDAVAFLANGKLITGDTLFVDGCGRCDLAGGDVEAMYESLFEKILKIDDATEIYPGHDYGPRPFDKLSDQLRTNRFLACKSKEEFIQLRGD